MDQLQVSKLIKKYILSANEEIHDNFKSTLNSVEDRMIEEVLETPLQSNYLAIRPILEKELGLFVDNLITIIDYYSQGVFYDGKVSTRKKLKLEIEKVKDKKYNFNYLDELFLEKFRFDKLNKLSHNLKNATVNYVIDSITNKIQGQWNLNSDDDSQHFVYTNQVLDKDSVEKIVGVVLKSISSMSDEVCELVTKELISLFRRGQLQEYKNLGIEKIKMNSSNDDLSCPTCKVRNSSVINIDNVLDDMGVNNDIIHPFCKVSLEPVINYDGLDFNDPLNNFRSLFREHGFSEQVPDYNNHNITLDKNINFRVENMSCNEMKFFNVPSEIEENLNKLFSKIKIYLSDFVKPLEFHFVNDVSNDENWFNEIKEAYAQDNNDFDAEIKAYIDQDMLTKQITYFRGKNNRILVSDFALLDTKVEDIVIRELFRNTTLNDFNWWKQQYLSKVKSKVVGEGLVFYKSPFVNILAESSVGDFVLESIVVYVNNPQLLNALDEEVFMKIKEDIFNGVQFS